MLKIILYKLLPLTHPPNKTRGLIEKVALDQIKPHKTARSTNIAFERGLSR